MGLFQQPDCTKTGVSLGPLQLEIHQGQGRSGGGRPCCCDGATKAEVLDLT